MPYYRHFLSPIFRGDSINRGNMRLKIFNAPAEFFAGAFLFTDFPDYPTTPNNRLLKTETYCTMFSF